MSTSLDCGDLGNNLSNPFGDKRQHTGRFKAEYSHPFMNIDAIVVPESAEGSVS